MRRSTLSLMIVGTLVAPALLPTLAMADNASLQQEVDALKKQNKLILERLDATMDSMEEAEPTSGHGMGGHGSRGATTVGGYGEMHYNNLSNKLAGGSDKKEVDFHRFVLFFGHEFSSKIRFFSEVEIEHAMLKDTANGSNGGEVAIEQAYIEFDLNTNTSVRTGVILVPVGMINETHEPTTFYGVERNNVEKYILPTTWREGGASLVGRFGKGFNYDLAVHSGLQTSSSSDYAVRKGRQGVANAPANDLAVTARLNWMGVPGLVIGAAIQQQSDVTQSTDPTAGSATLVSAHADWQVSQFRLRALYANWSLSGAGPAAVGADKQHGAYIEPSWKFNPKFGVFARASQWDNTANSAVDSQYDQVDVGFNYWPHEDVVLKLDYQDQSSPSGKDEYDGFNLGVGYQF